VSTQLELADSRLLLVQAEANRAQAARDLQVARARIALLPDLPLGMLSNQSGAGSQQSTSQSAPQTTTQPSVPAAAGSQFTNSATSTSQTGANR
jgi:hypothetical protein